MGIIAVAVFEMFSTTNRVKYYTLGKLVFGCDTIILIRNNIDW